MEIVAALTFMCVPIVMLMIFSITVVLIVGSSRSGNSEIENVLNELHESVKSLNKEK